MSQTNGRSKLFGSGVLCIIDDNFDLLEVNKSVFKEPDYKILPASTGALLNMARGTLIDRLHTEEKRSSTYKVAAIVRENFRECAIRNKPFFV